MTYEVEDVQEKILEVDGKFREIQNRLKNLEIRPNDLLENFKIALFCSHLKLLTIDGHTSGTVFKTENYLVSTTDGWTE